MWDNHGVTSQTQYLITDATTACIRYTLDAQRWHLFPSYGIHANFKLCQEIVCSQQPVSERRTLGPSVLWILKQCPGNVYSRLLHHLLSIATGAHLQAVSKLLLQQICVS